MLIRNGAGNYSFLQGIAAYSSGVIADRGYEIVHATLREPLPLRRGFDLIARHLLSIGRPVQALCAVELRSPRQFTFEGFDEFNRETYRPLLREHKLLIDEVNPLARSNLVPEINPPREPSLFAFSYTVPGTSGAGPADFVVAGAGELGAEAYAPTSIVRRDDTSAEGMRDKAVCVMGHMGERLQGLGAEWAQVTMVNVYTVFDIFSFLREDLLAPLGAAGQFGLHWYLVRPPIVQLEFEMDVRRTTTELWL